MFFPEKTVSDKLRNFAPRIDILSCEVAVITSGIKTRTTMSPEAWSCNLPLGWHLFFYNLNYENYSSNIKCHTDSSDMYLRDTRKCHRNV